MRKQKAYIGKNKNVSNFGVNAKGVWTVPRLLRPFFLLQVRRDGRIFELKLRVNGQSGALTQDSSASYADAIAERRAVKQRLMSGSWAGGVI